MKIGTVLFAFAAMLFCAGTAFAEDPESYRTTLLSRPLSEGHAAFCNGKDNLQDCQVTLNFLKDIKAGQVPKDSAGKDTCPRGAHTRYAGNDKNEKEIANRCTP
ncbi:MAG: hypothetical protein HY926_07470 [Elusimicrobia bacterium]|nr:hypothetical protein [Elusimicrobiota bacterium]